MSFAQYFAIEKKLKQQGFDFERSDAILQLTNNRKSSLKELTPNEYRELIEWLNRQTSSQAVPPTDKMQQQRRKIIALLCKCGFVNGVKPDMHRVYEWVKVRGYLHKPLNDYTEAELPKLVYQAEQFMNSHINRL